MLGTIARTAGALLATALLATSATAQVQVLDAGEPVTIDSTTPVVIDTVAINTTGLRDVLLAAHFYVEGSAFSGGGYEFRLERTTPSTAVVGTANWAPAVSLNASVSGDTVSITGFDESVMAPTSYRLVGQKISAGAANLSVTKRGIDAIDRSSGTIVTGVRAASSVLVTTSLFTPIQTLDVDILFPSDVLLLGHATVSTGGTSEGGYGIGICDANDDVLFFGAWIPGTETAETNIIAVAAIDFDVAADTTYSLCTARIGGAPAATVTFRSLQAVRSIGQISGSDPDEVPLLTSTAYTTIWILDAANTDPAGMAIVAQTSPISGSGYKNDLYEFGIHRGSCAGPLLGATNWRPGLSATTDTATDSLLLTAFDPAPGEPQSYAFCARKASAAAPDLNFYGLTMAAAPLPVPEPGGGPAAFACCAALYAIARSRRAATVSAPSGRARPR